MKKLFYSFLFLSLLFSYGIDVFGSSGEILSVPKTETIREMQESADILKKEQEKLNFKWSTYQIGNESLKDFIKDLDTDSFETLVEIITTYEDNTANLEEKLEKKILASQKTDEIYAEILLLKKDFYTQLIAYIKPEKLGAYKNYISSDVLYNEKSKKVDVEIQQIEVKKKERIEEIKDKIEGNNALLRESIEQKVRDKVAQRLSLFLTEEKFSSLEAKNKIMVFEKLGERVRSIKLEYEQDTNRTSILDEKILILEVVEDIIDSYIIQWK